MNESKIDDVTDTVTDVSDEVSEAGTKLVKAYSTLIERLNDFGTATNGYKPEQHKLYRRDMDPKDVFAAMKNLPARDAKVHSVHVPAFLTHVDGDTCVLLVEQLRAPLECPCIEFIAGKADKEGMTLEQMGIEEINEESGLEFRGWLSEIYTMVKDPGWTNASCVTRVAEVRMPSDGRIPKPRREDKHITTHVVKLSDLSERLTTWEKEEKKIDVMVSQFSMWQQFSQFLLSDEIRPCGQSKPETSVDDDLTRVSSLDQEESDD